MDPTSFSLERAGIRNFGQIIRTLIYQVGIRGLEKNKDRTCTLKNGGH